MRGRRLQCKEHWLGSPGPRQQSAHWSLTFGTTADSLLSLNECVSTFVTESGANWSDTPTGSNLTALAFAVPSARKSLSPATHTAHSLTSSALPKCQIITFLFRRSSLLPLSLHNPAPPALHSSMTLVTIWCTVFLICLLSFFPLDFKFHERDLFCPLFCGVLGIKYISKHLLKEWIKCQLQSPNYSGYTGKFSLGGWILTAYQQG